MIWLMVTILSGSSTVVINTPSSLQRFCKPVHHAGKLKAEQLRVSWFSFLGFADFHLHVLMAPFMLSDLQQSLQYATFHE